MYFIYKSNHNQRSNLNSVILTSMIMLTSIFIDFIKNDLLRLQQTKAI